MDNGVTFQEFETLEKFWRKVKRLGVKSTCFETIKNNGHTDDADWADLHGFYF